MWFEFSSIIAPVMVIALLLPSLMYCREVRVGLEVKYTETSSDLRVSWCEFVNQEFPADFMDCVLEMSKVTKDTSNLEHVVSKYLNEEQIVIGKTAFSTSSFAPLIEYSKSLFRLAISTLDKTNVNSCATFAMCGGDCVAYYHSDVKSLLTQTSSVESLPDDHIFSTSPNNPNIMLYGCIEDPNLHHWLSLLSELVQEGRINFIYRHSYHTQSNLHDAVSLSGYGIFLDIKNMEYRNIDDVSKPVASDSSLMTNGENALTCNEKIMGIDFSVLKSRYSSSGDTISSLDSFCRLQVLNAANAGKADPYSMIVSGGDEIGEDIKVWKMNDLGLQVLSMFRLDDAASLMSSVDVMTRMEEIILNFPKYGSRISQLIEVDEDLRGEMADIALLLRRDTISLDVGNVYVNGKEVDFTKAGFNFFNFFKSVRAEMQFLRKLKYIIPDDALFDRNCYLSAIQSDMNLSPAMSQSTLSSSSRIDFSKFLPVKSDRSRYPIVFLNNIEKDDEYASYFESIDELKSSSRSLVPIQKNMYNSVAVLDFTKIEGIELWMTFASIYESHYPLRIGLVVVDEADIKLFSPRDDFKDADQLEYLVSSDGNMLKKESRDWPTANNTQIPWNKMEIARNAIASAKDINRLFITTLLEFGTDNAFRFLYQACQASIMDYRQKMQRLGENAEFVTTIDQILTAYVRASSEFNMASVPAANEELAVEFMEMSRQSVRRRAVDILSKQGKEQENSERMLWKMAEFVVKSGLPINSWSLNGHVFETVASLQSLPMLLAEEQKIYTKLVRSGLINDGTKHLSKVLVESTAASSLVASNPFRYHKILGMQLSSIGSDGYFGTVNEADVDPSGWVQLMNLRVANFLPIEIRKHAAPHPWLALMDQFSLTSVFDSSFPTDSLMFLLDSSGNSSESQNVLVELGHFISSDQFKKSNTQVSIFFQGDANGLISQPFLDMIRFIHLLMANNRNIDSFSAVGSALQHIGKSLNFLSISKWTSELKNNMISLPTSLICDDNRLEAICNICKEFKTDMQATVELNAIKQLREYSLRTLGPPKVKLSDKRLDFGTVVVGGSLAVIVDHEDGVEFIEQDFWTLIHLNAMKLDKVNCDNAALRNRIMASLHISDCSSRIVMNSFTGIYGNGRSNIKNDIKAASPSMTYYASKNSLVNRKQTSNDLASSIELIAVLDPLSTAAQRALPILKYLYSQTESLSSFSLDIAVWMIPETESVTKFPLQNFYRFDLGSEAVFDKLPTKPVLTVRPDVPEPWDVQSSQAVKDIDNLMCSFNSTGCGDDENSETSVVIYQLKSIIVFGQCFELPSFNRPNGLQVVMKRITSLSQEKTYMDQSDTLVMQNLGYYQLKAFPGAWDLGLADGRASYLFELAKERPVVAVRSFEDQIHMLFVQKKEGRENLTLLVSADEEAAEVAPQEKSVSEMVFGGLKSFFASSTPAVPSVEARNQSSDTVNIFSLASGHLYERMLRIMMLSVRKRISGNVKFWLLENFLSPPFKNSALKMAKMLDFEVEFVTYKWPQWLHQEHEKQRIIWGYKILFLDVLFPLGVNKIIYVDADQVIRADLRELWDMKLEREVSVLDNALNMLQGHRSSGKKVRAPYAYVPFCTSREETLGFQFWRQGYWKDHLRGKPYHISALYVVDLQRFRETAVGDTLRTLYDGLARDPNSLSNLDQDLPNYAQHRVPIFSLPQDWLWCETWCSDESKTTSKTIDLCNNPLHKEPKLNMAKRIISGKPLFNESWVELDEEVKALLEGV